MFVEITADGTVRLCEVADTKRFHIVAPATSSRAALDHALQAGSAGHLDGGEARISTSWVRAQAAGEPASWSERFEAMIGYARQKGWMSQDDELITAHIERRGS